MYLMWSSMEADSFSNPGHGSQAGGSGSSVPSGWQSYFSVVAYRPFFNVDTNDVLDRVRDSLFPLKGDFVEKTSHNPDMYTSFNLISIIISQCISLKFGGYHLFVDLLWCFYNLTTWLW